MTIISAGLSRFSNIPTTDLNGAINSSVTSIVVDSNLGFPYPGPFRILIDNEQMQVTAGSNTTTWTVIRAVDGTAAASHLDEAPVTNNITAFDFNSFRGEFNPIAYGAVGDGAADDYTPFQNAINDAHALAGGGHIFLPDLPFKVNSSLTGYANVVFITYGAVISGTGAASVAPLIRWSQLGGLTLPAILTILSGGASITGNVSITGNATITGTTTLNTKTYTWPASFGSAGQVLTGDGAGALSWAASGGAVSSVSGTANQISVSPTTGATIVGLQAGGTLPGTWNAETGFIVLAGGLSINAGGMNISAGGATIVGGITGTLATAAQPNVTSLGTLASLGVTGAITSVGTTVGAGALGYAQSSSTQTGITSEVNLTGLQVAVTVAAGRRIKITGKVFCRASTLDNTEATIRIKDSLNVEYNEALAICGGDNSRVVLMISAIVQPTAGSHTYKLTMQRQNGTGVLAADAISARPNYILVEDIGV